MVRRDARGADPLPVDATTLVGRQAEAAELRSLLSRSRLVTLVGPGGVGKTRLALHVARGARSAFEDGVHLVPLAELSQPDLVVSAVAAALDPRGATPLDAQDLVSRVGAARTLLVLDNCEHLVDAAADVVVRLLRGCPHLRVLATSREALRVEGEALYRVPPLALPPGDAVLGPGDAVRYDGVALFLERAAAVNADAAGGRVDDAAVAELCRRLDGLPLAIELAAAGTRWRSVESMLDRPLTAAPPVSRSLPGRHQSLRASLDYSHDLCSPAARTLWARLSVFRGGATLEAVEAVCAGPPLPAEEVFGALAELVDKSVVTLEGSRYAMLETIRQYGARRLAEAGEEDQVRLAHLRHVVALAAEVRASWFGPHQRELLARVRADQANVRAALELSLSTPATLSAGLATAADLWTFWIGSGLPGEGRRWLGRLLAADLGREDGAGPRPERVRALWTHGFLSAVDDDIPAARRLLAECLEAAAVVGDTASAAHARSTLGVADLFQGRLAEAVTHLEAGVAAERSEAGSAPYLADALINLGLAHCYRGDLEAARAVLDEASELCSARGEVLLLSWALVFRSLRALLAGETEESAELARAALRHKRELGNAQGVVWAVELLAWCAVERGDAARAALLLGAAEARAHDFGPAFHGFPGMPEWHAAYVARAGAALGPAALRQAAARGSRLSLEELTTLALGERDDLPERGADDARAPARPPAPLLGDLPLTEREREVALLVATGKTNREIAEELVIAPRTVDSHVQHILTKLDFTSRHQVVALLAARPAG